MPDVIEPTPPAVDQSGNLLLLWVTTIADVNAPKVATELKAASSKRLTYSFTADGWQTTGEQALEKDDRLTLPQPLEAFGQTTRGLSLRYVDSTDPNSAAVVLVPGTAGYLVERRGVPNRTDLAAGQKVTVWPCVLGAQIPEAPAGTGKFTILQKVALTGVVGAPVTTVA